MMIMVSVWMNSACSCVVVYELILCMSHTCTCARIHTCTHTHTHTHAHAHTHTHTHTTTYYIHGWFAYLHTSDDNVELSSSDDDELNKMVNISSFTKGEGILHSFPCSEIKDDFYIPRYSLAQHYLLKLVYPACDCCQESMSISGIYVW